MMYWVCEYFCKQKKSLLTLKKSTFLNMKKTTTLLLICTALLVFGMAQSKTGNIPEKFGKERFCKEKILERSLEKSKPELFKKQQSVIPKHTTAYRGGDWWEPDTVLIYTTEFDEPTTRFIWSYDENGNCITKITQIYDIHLNKWITTQLNTYTYDTHNNILEAIEQYWNEETEELQNNSKSKYTYNTQNHEIEYLYYYIWESGQWKLDEIQNWVYEQNNLVEDTRQYWDDDLGWVYNYKNTYQYDEQNNLKESIHQQRDWNPYTGGTGELINQGKITYLYDMYNNVKEETEYGWDTDYEQWMVVLKEINIYDTYNNLTENIFQYPDWETGELVNAIKNSYAYNTHNNMTEWLQQFWESNDWVNSWQEIYTYDTQNNLIQYNYYVWGSDDWIDNWGEIYTYDTHNNLTEYNRFEWQSGERIYTVKINSTYDTQNNLIEQIHQEWDWELSQLGIPVTYSYTYDDNNNAIAGFCQKENVYFDGYDLLMFYNNMQSSQWFGQIAKFTATYSKTVTVSIRENEIANTIKLYPNPVSDILNIETDTNIVPEVKIYSIQGQLLLNIKGNYIDVSSLSTGIYIANINGQCIKVVKQ